MFTLKITFISYKKVECLISTQMDPKTNTEITNPEFSVDLIISHSDKKKPNNKRGLVLIFQIIKENLVS